MVTRKGLHHVWHYIAQQKTHHQQRDNQQDHRVNHRQLYLLPQGLMVLAMLGQTLEHTCQVAGTFGSGHGGPINHGECLWVMRQGLRQRMAFGNPLSHAAQYLTYVARSTLLGNCLQRLGQRYPGMQQSRQLARQQRAPGQTQGIACQQPGKRRCPQGAHAQYQQPLLAQCLPGLART
ncbi:hypothetical protein D3C75_853110 [compost metagenome]